MNAPNISATESSAPTADAPRPNAPRIALAGIVLESNAFAPVAGEADFRGRYYFEGQQLLDEARREGSIMSREMAAFVAAMDATGPWTPVPLIITGCQPWGPVDQSFFAATLDRILSGLEGQGIDGVYIANHGAMVATVSTDPDGDMLAAVRRAVGAQCPLICTLDLHANVSSRMAKSADVLISYLTNPHVDQIECGEEAAFVMRAMLAGMRPRSHHIQLPLTPASVSLLSASGPYGEIIDYGQRRKRESAGAILNVSITGNFTFSDTPENGMSVTVTAREDEHAAIALAREIAVRIWGMRERYKRDLTSVDEALAIAQAASSGQRQPVIFSDAGDNPGGGGSGRTTELLAALVDAAVPGVLYGSFFDPALASEAHTLGVGATFEAVFNRQPWTAFDTRFACPATVLALGDGDVIGRRGLYQGRGLALGPSAALSLGGGKLTVIIISDRNQTADPMFFEMLGCDPSAAAVVCVKSRGHFRAGFDEWFTPQQVFEVDTAGLTSPVLERLEWKRLPRPVYPLDEDTQWAPELSNQ
jgi:microcystin degradation protein MlrC